MPRGRRGESGSLPLLAPPLAVDLAHHGWQIARQAERQPAPGVMVERDGARAHAAGVDAGPRRPLADAGSSWRLPTM